MIPEICVHFDYYINKNIDELREHISNEMFEDIENEIDMIIEHSKLIQEYLDKKARCAMEAA